MIFKHIFCMLRFVIFIKIFEYRYILQILSQNTAAHICRVSGCFKSL